MVILNYIEMTCCKNFTSEIDDSVGEYCSNCYSLTEAVIFETPFTEPASNPKIRANKFFLLLNTGDLPWYVRQTMLDVFPKIESYFFRSDRVNFIHMGQLIIELLTITGYEQYSKSYKGLKTATRVKMVKLFVRDALKGSISDVRLPRLEELEYLCPIEPYVDFSKVVKDGHVYSDKKK